MIDVKGLARAAQRALTRLGYCHESENGSMWEVGFSDLAYAAESKAGPVGVLVVDVHRLPRKVTVDALMSPRTLRHLTAVVGYEVRASTRRGLVYVVLLSQRKRKRLARRVALPDGAPVLDGVADGRELLVPIGETLAGPLWRTLPDLDTVLVAGQRGKGKSMWLNTMLAALLSAHGPEALQVALVDPKEVELAFWDGAPHLMAEIAVDEAGARAVLGLVLGELDRRRALFRAARARKLAEYNAGRAEGRLAAILVVVDELGDLAWAAGGVRSGALGLLASVLMKGAAFGIYVVVATQRPDADAVSGIIKANLATRIAFWLPSDLDYRIALQPAAGTKLPPLPRVPGRCLVRLDDGYEVAQGYCLESTRLEALAEGVRGGLLPSAPLSAAELVMVREAVAERAGYLPRAEIARALGVSDWQAGRLGAEWEMRGLLVKDAQSNNCRRVTARLVELAAGCSGVVGGC